MAIQPPMQRGGTQMTLDRLMEIAGFPRKATRNENVDFSGLSVFEVRAQCAIVTAVVRDRLIVPERYAIEAWYALDQRKPEAIDYLCTWCAPHWTIDSPQARMMITWSVNLQRGSKGARMCSLRKIEADCGVPKTTIYTQQQKIADAVIALRDRAHSRLEDIFIAEGLVAE